MKKRRDSGLVLRRARREGGFTLVEVLVALAIAGGSLVLLLSATGASFRRSARARLSERLERAAESRFAEWRVGADRAVDGPLPGFDRHRWEIRSAPETLPGLKRMRRVTFRVHGPQEGAPLLERALLVSGEAP